MNQHMDLTDPIYVVLYKYTKALSAALEYRDSYTRLHSERVMGLSEAIGLSCGLSESELGILRIAAMFHDVGKIGIRDDILLKPTQLDDAEWAAMKMHSEFGEKIIASTELQGSQQAALVIRYHHEHFNGRGYPEGLSGVQIPIYSRILTIADSYDAMAVTRSYQRARTHQEIVAILHKEVGVKHDPDLMEHFFRIIEFSKFKAALV